MNQRAFWNRLRRLSLQLCIIVVAAHADAVRIFVNWFLSREGQLAWQKQTDPISRKTDIPKDSISNWTVKVPPDDGNYIFTNLPRYNDLKPR